MTSVSLSTEMEFTILRCCVLEEEELQFAWETVVVPWYARNTDDGFFAGLARGSREKLVQ